MESSKPGYLSTEWWLSLAAAVTGALLTSGVIETGSTWDKLIGLLATVLAALGYTVSRTLVKSSTTKAAALVEASKASPTKP